MTATDYVEYIFLGIVTPLSQNKKKKHKTLDSIQNAHTLTHAHTHTHLHTHTYKHKQTVLGKKPPEKRPWKKAPGKVRKKAPWKNTPGEKGPR